MHVAIQNPFSEPWVAEAELSRRLYRAATRLGWQAIEVHTGAEIQAVAPDFVIALHSNSPKLAGYPTYGCMWNPPSMFEGTDPFVTNVLSYDGYLISAASIERWLHRLLCNTPKPFLKAPFYTSCPQTDYQPPSLEQPRLFYCGSNWDGPRFPELFEQLDRQPYLEVYGNPDGWTHLHHSYRGALPYDGISVLEALHRAGVGLCLHRGQHHEAAVPSMRIFEIVAAGAIAICGDHAFIRAAFGDTVLYIDPDTSAATQVEQINAHMDWIATHPDQARSMTRRAHDIFSQHYSLEHLLQGLLPLHQQVLERKGFSRKDRTGAIAPIPTRRVSYLVRTGTDPQDLQQRLDSLARQTFSPIQVLIVPELPFPSLEALLQPYRERLSIQVLAPVVEETFPPEQPYRSTLLWQGLAALAQAESDYFGILDQTVLHPNHVHTLVNLLDRNPAVGAGYSGGLPCMSTPPPPPLDLAAPTTILLGFQPFHLLDFLSQQQSLIPDAFLIRSSLLPCLPPTDPQMNRAEVLCLLISLCQHSRFLFSYEATCQVDPTCLQLTDPEGQEAIAALRFVFWHQEIGPGLRLTQGHESTIQTDRLSRLHPLEQHLQLLEHRQQELEKTLHTTLHAQARHLSHTRQQLQEAQDTIAAMQSSKFWKLRKLWFRLKRWLGKGGGRRGVKGDEE